MGKAISGNSASSSSGFNSTAEVQAYIDALLNGTMLPDVEVTDLREGQWPSWWGSEEFMNDGGGLQQAGLGMDVSLSLLSMGSYATGVYEDARAGQIAKYTKGYLREWQQIRNFNKGYKTARQAILANNIVKNVNMLDGIKVGARRMIGVGLVLGVADMANNDFSAESVGWFAADTIMTGVGLTGWGAPVAGVYFLGRFAYGIYDMSTK